MDDQDNENLYLPPIHTNTFAVPQDHGLMLAYDVYKPSLDTKKLQSEQGRHIYAETFIEDMKLGTLSDLSVRALAKEFGPYGAFPMVSSDPLKLRIHYDSLKVDLPLDKCYHITDEGYWRRVVLSKSEDKALAFMKEYDWRGHGISLKYVELVEACSAEYWEEEKMTALALKVKDFVTHMHIRRLQSLQLRSFERFFDSEQEEDSLGSEDSSEMSTVSETSELSEEEGQPPADGGDDAIIEKTESQLEFEQKQANEKMSQKQALHEDRERRRHLRVVKQQRRERRAAKRLAAMEVEMAQAAQKKKKKKKNIKSIFDIELSSDEDNREDDEKLNIVDHRNKASCLHRMKKYKYPQEDCHHIDLSFIRHFDCLTTFIIEFLGPLQQRDYHVRHMNFSYDDINRLANGLSYLRQLKVFRLRNSRMDERKLSTLVSVLCHMEHLEVVDFGHNQLQDDCGNAVYTLLTGSNIGIRTLELEGNFFGIETMQQLGKAIGEYGGELNYLGLSNILLGDEAMRILVMYILDTEQVRELNLTGVYLSQEGIISHIANELLRLHPILIRLELVGIHIGWTAGNELVKALATNKTILDLDCRGCNLEYDVEFDVAILLRRNRFIAENPFVGEETKTEEEINEWVSRVKNPIILDAMDKVAQRDACYTQRPSEFTLDTVKSGILSEKQNSEISLDTQAQQTSKTSVSRQSSDSCLSCKMPFVYNTSEFDEEQFLQHIFVPGPGERFYYFQEMKRPGYNKEIE